jgi:hypothetical protein
VQAVARTWKVNESQDLCVATVKRRVSRRVLDHLVAPYEAEVATALEPPGAGWRWAVVGFERLFGAED